MFWSRHEDFLVCIRHRRLLGLAEKDLSAIPEIFQANRRHRQLIQRFGRENVRQAFAAAGRILGHWERNHFLGPAHQRLETILGGPRRSAGHVSYDDYRFQAARYPETIALTRLLASTYWKSLITTGHLLWPEPDDFHTYDTFMRGIDWSTHVAGRHYVMAASTPAIHRFLAEIERTTGHNIRWLPSMHNGTYDPLADWVVEQLDRSHGLWQPDVGQPREPVPETFP
jgi:hypothetical protein